MTTVRYFFAEDDGSLTRVPLTKMQGWSHGQPLPPRLGGRELRFLEVSVEADRYLVEEIHRILPFRLQVGKDGRRDRPAGMRLVRKRLDILDRLREGGGPETDIELLEADANYFWWPTDANLKTLGTALLKQPTSSARLADLRAKVYKPGDARSRSH